MNGNKHPPTPSQCERLCNQIDTLFHVRAPPACRRIKHLKLYLSTLFDPIPTPVLELDGWTELMVKTMREVMLRLSTVIRSLEGLQSAEIFIEGNEPIVFYYNLSHALEACPELHSLDFKFLKNSRFLQYFPIIHSKHIDSIKLTWSLSSAQEVTSNPSLTGNPCVYSKLFRNDSGQNLRRLELWSKTPPEHHAFRRSVSLQAFSQLEELTLINIPLIIHRLVDIAEMPNLTSLRLEGFRNTLIVGYPSHDPYHDMWGALRLVKRQLKVIQIDFVSPNLVSYLCSYIGLQALVLTLGTNSNCTLTESFFKYGISPHKETLKVFAVDLCPQTEPANRWYYEYWRNMVDLRNVRIFKMTIALNIAWSKIDMTEFKKHLLGLALSSPLKQLMVRYWHEQHVNMFEKKLDESLTEDPLWIFPEPFTFEPNFQLCLGNIKRKYRVETVHGAGFVGIINIIGVNR